MTALSSPAEFVSSPIDRRFDLSLNVVSRGIFSQGELCVSKQVVSEDDF